MFASIASGLGIVSRRASTIPAKDSGRMHAAQRSTLSEQSSADDPLGSDDGRPQLMCMEGWMQKEGSVFKTWKKRYFRLNGLFLAYYTAEDEVKGLIFLEGAIVRDSLRKNMETGFELVCNPSPQSREGGLVLGADGAQYASGAATASAPGGPATPSTRPSSSSVSSATAPSSSSSSSDPSQSERIYYLYLDPTTPPSVAMQQRKEWMSTIRNNVSYASRLRSWYAEREEKQRALVERLRAQVEAVRAEREMERFAALSKAREAEAQANEAALKAKHAEAEANAAAAAKKDPGGAHNRTKSSLAAAASSSTTTDFDPLSADGGASAPAEAAEALEALARDEAQRQADSVLIGGEHTDSSALLAALKRKNQALEHDVRLILTENASLKAAAARAMDQARQEVEDEHAALDERAEELTRMEVAAMEARNKAEAALAANAAQIAALQAQVASLQSAASSSAQHPPPSLVTSSSAVEEIMAQAATPHPSASSGAGNMMSPSPSFSMHPSASNLGPFGSGGSPAAKNQQPSSPHAAAPANATPLPDGSAPCTCTCSPPCVPYSAQRSTLKALDGLESKYASAVMDRANTEQKAEKLRQEKKVLKQEVIRLRMMLQQQENGSAALPPGAK